MLPTKPGCCEFCPVRPGVPAVRTWVDLTEPGRHEYHLCQRHYWPLERWVRRRQLAARDQELSRLVDRLERLVR